MTNPLSDLEPSLSFNIPVSDLGHLVDLIASSSQAAAPLKAFGEGLGGVLSESGATVQLSIKIA